MELISKELFSIVMGITLMSDDGYHKGRVLRIQENTVKYFKSSTKWGDYCEKINIHELAYKCKLWAGELDYLLESATKTKSNYSTSFCVLDNTVEDCNEIFKCHTEPEAIFKACEWIHERRKNNE